MIRPWLLFCSVVTVVLGCSADDMTMVASAMVSPLDPPTGAIAPELIWYPLQEMDIQVSAAELSSGKVELWSEGSADENAGGGVQISLDASHLPVAWIRQAADLSALQATLAPVSID